MTKKQIEQRIDRLYARHCHGIQVPIMKLSFIHQAGMAAMKAGADDDGIGYALKAAALSVAVN